MSVAELIVCEWVDRRCKETRTLRPTWGQVQAAIERLNNREFNDLYLIPLQGDRETYLCVGGGGGRYIVAGSISNSRFPAVINPGKSARGEERVTVGGQEGLYSEQQVVDLATALTAAESFFRSGQFGGGDVEWRED